MSEEGRPKRERKAVEHFQIEETTTVKEVKIPVSFMLTLKIINANTFIETIFLIF
jgi:hypothetical protein